MSSQISSNSCNLIQIQQTSPFFRHSLSYGASRYVWTRFETKTFFLQLPWYSASKYSFKSLSIELAFFFTICNTKSDKISLSNNSTVVLSGLIWQKGHLCLQSSNVHVNALVTGNIFKNFRAFALVLLRQVIVKIVLIKSALFIQEF